MAYLAWRTFAERLLTLGQAWGVVLLSAIFAAAWLTMLRAAGLSLAERPATDALRMLLPPLLPLTISVLARGRAAAFAICEEILMQKRKESPMVDRLIGVGLLSAGVLAGVVLARLGQSPSCQLRAGGSAARGFLNQKKGPTRSDRGSGRRTTSALDSRR